MDEGNYGGVLDHANDGSHKPRDERPKRHAAGSPRQEIEAHAFSNSEDHVREEQPFAKEIRRLLVREAKQLLAVADGDLLAAEAVYRTDDRPRKPAQHADERTYTTDLHDSSVAHLILLAFHRLAFILARFSLDIKAGNLRVWHLSFRPGGALDFRQAKKHAFRRMCPAAPIPILGR
jgi:hypothetical protein